MVVPAELDGVQIRPIAAGAHWQLGKCETHGGWFNRVLEKLIEEFSPSSKEEWLECVVHAHIKNQQLQVHGFSPYQLVFGRNPHIPQDLLNEPLQVISATASLTEASIARACPYSIGSDARRSSPAGGSVGTSPSGNDFQSG